MKKIVPLALSALMFTQVGCGTLLYPERQGQSPGRIDTSVLILDGIGLLFFVVPGLIAFAVDFSNGTIYLPEGSNFAKSDQLTRKLFVSGDLDTPRINQIIEQELNISNVLAHERLLQVGSDDLSVALRASPMLGSS